MNIRKPNFMLAVIPMAAMLFLLIVGFTFLGISIEVLMLVSAIITSGIALYLGHSWENIQKSIVEKIKTTMPALFILIIVGGLIGSWMVGGTIPFLVYYGLKIISPEYLLVTTFLVCCIVSVCTGTSWGSAGTVGVALMSVAMGMDANLAPVAGAVVSGAYFGDKISPLSDTTNFAPVVAGTDLYSHIKHLLWTTIPAFIVSVIVFTAMGFSSLAADVATPEKITAILTNLDELFNLNILLLLPPVLVLGGAIKKLPTVPLMLAACMIAIFNAVVFQGFDLTTASTAFLNGFSVEMFSDLNLSGSAVIPDVAKLVNRGGLSSMMGVILLVFCAFSFAGAMSVIGGLNIIVNSMAKGIRSVTSLIGATLATTIIVVATTCDGKLALLIPSELFRELYHKMNLDPVNLSRSTEDAGTVIEPLIPWTSAGIFMATTLGVPTLSYLPWAVQCYTGIIFAMIWAVTDKGIKYLNSSQTHQENKQ
ncbi:Na+/H+ antiporter NhaC [Vibrio sp. SA48]|uniref:Na+/H+ antiporter NhaC n=1 Tax=Vibrio sp. S12_S33 TaxID=2720223 RepID=UPI00178232D0|nr:Na+/H+ antiporter NhaC [Vibrio sp. S12_S33]MBD1567321.1 Na+/H+ antiporter NhaC [Vibrio sp. S12_S33]